jgi:hypothetical protein
MGDSSRLEEVSSTAEKRHYAIESLRAALLFPWLERESFPFSEEIAVKIHQYDHRLHWMGPILKPGVGRFHVSEHRSCRASTSISQKLKPGLLWVAPC